MKNKTNRAIMWILSNAAFVWCCYAWTLDGKEWAGNIAKFMCWIMAIGGACCFSENVQKEAAKKGRSVPKFLGWFTDFAALLMLAAASHYWMCAAVFLSMCGETAAYQHEDEKEDA